jgi:hypothetical protein
MSEPFGFDCVTCGEYHVGLPSPGWDYPIHYLCVPEAERDRRVELTPDACIIDRKWFFIRGCLDIPVRDHEEPLSWGVWCSISAGGFRRYEELFQQVDRDTDEAFCGWLCSAIPSYPDTLELKTLVRVRPWPSRPYIELEPTDHPLAIDQREGITSGRAREIIEQIMHRRTPGTQENS